MYSFFCCRRFHPSKLFRPICLGILSSINRDKQIEQTRMCIGKGVHLYKVCGVVYAECLSKSRIFVQSPGTNIACGWTPATVRKVSPGETVQLFNDQSFAAQLCRSANSDFEAVYELTKFCIIRISFLKGWGEKYCRQTVTAILLAGSKFI